MILHVYVPVIRSPFIVSWLNVILFSLLHWTHVCHSRPNPTPPSTPRNSFSNHCTEKPIKACHIYTPTVILQKFTSSLVSFSLLYGSRSGFHCCFPSLACQISCSILKNLSNISQNLAVFSNSSILVILNTELTDELKAYAINKHLMSLN